MKRSLACFAGIVFILLPFSGNSQNNINNPWQIWYPELLGYYSDAPWSAFNFGAKTNTIKDKVGNGTAGAGYCSSYTTGNDLRGNVYYSSTDHDIKIIGSKNHAIIGTISYQSLIPVAGIANWDPHTILGFYVSATNKQYIAVSGAGVDLSVLGIAIFDVTNPALVTLAKKITIPSSLVCLQNNATVSSGASAQRMTGMAIQQIGYSSAMTQFYCVIDDGTKTGSTVKLGLSGVNLNNHPGVWLKISDPLNTVPAVQIQETYYTAGTTTGAIFPKTDAASAGGHHIAYNKILDQVFISSEYTNAILSFNAGGSSGNFNASNNIYQAGTANISPAATPTSNIGFHNLYVNKAGTAIYSGKVSMGSLACGEDRVLKFTIAPNKVTVSKTNESLASPSFAVFTGIGTIDADSVNLVKGINFTPDEQYLYSSLSSPFFYYMDRIFSLNPASLAILQSVQNNGGGEAHFDHIDPHSYAFGLNDYGDAPASYGVAVHNLVNDNFTEDRLRIGSYIDGDTASSPSVDFTGDDLSKTGGSGTGLNIDEDGITTTMKAAMTSLWSGMTTTINTYTINSIVVKNTSNSDAKLAGWIDFNHDGFFTAGEGAIVTVPIGSTTANLSWTIPADVTSGPVILRLRLSTDGSLTAATPSTAMMDGEVEDYLVATSIPVNGNVFNDANANTLYGTSGSTGSGEIAFNTGISLYAYLIKDGVIIDTAHVTADGTYSFPLAPKNAGDAFIMIGSNSLPVRSAPAMIVSISSLPPAGWQFTGSSSGLISNGLYGFLDVSLNTLPVINQNFGLQLIFAALPVRLESFTAKLAGNAVVLNWLFGEENNVASYQIAFSTDRINFEVISNQPATGSRSYTAIHNQPIPGVNYYRLTTFDKDGQISLSEIRAVNRTAGSSVQISPNPSGGLIKINLTDNWRNNHSTISIYNAAGQLLLTQALNGTAEIKINTSNYPRGTYIVHLEDRNGNSASEKFTVGK